MSPIDPNVAAALITGFLALAALAVSQVYRARNAKNPPPTPPIPPATSSEMWDFMTDLRDEVKGIRDELDKEKTARQTFTEAVRRYLEKLARSWGTPGTMPDPDEADLDVLKLTLPKRTPRKR
jgi:hypothetical protein